MSSKKHLLAAFGFASILGACGMGDELPPTRPTKDLGVKLDSGTSSQKANKPVIDPLPATVCSDTVPVQGTAAPGGSVFIMGGTATSGIATDVHPTTGCFCLDVPLKKASANQLEVRAHKTGLQPSDAVMLSVTQSTCRDDVPPPPVEQPKSKNVALGLKTKSNKEPIQGNMALITDGKTSPEVVFQHNDVNPVSDANIWVSIRLDKTTELEKIVVRWRDAAGSGCAFGSVYKVLYSAVTEPGDPSHSNGLWTVIDVPSGDGLIDTYDLKTAKPLAQHVAIWMNADGCQSWEETFALTEIEVWDSPKKVNTTPITTANTCANSSTCR